MGRRAPSVRFIEANGGGVVNCNRVARMAFSVLWNRANVCRQTRGLQPGNPTLPGRRVTLTAAAVPGPSGVDRYRRSLEASRRSPRGLCRERGQNGKAAPIISPCDRRACGVRGILGEWWLRYSDALLVAAPARCGASSCASMSFPSARYRIICATSARRP